MTAKKVVVRYDVVGDEFSHLYILRLPYRDVIPDPDFSATEIRLRPGGAAHLAMLARLALEGSGESIDAAATWKRVGQAGHGSGESVPSLHSAKLVAVWEPHPLSSTGPGVSRTPESTRRVWRIKELLGRHKFDPEENATHLATTREVGIDKSEESATNVPDVLLLDDSQLGFRSKTDAWPRYLVDGKQRERPRHIIVRTAEYIGEGPLWERLARRPKESVTAVVPVQALRRRHASIASGLSWDRYAEDLEREFKDGVLRRVFAGIDRVVVFAPGASIAWFEGSNGRLQLQHFSFDPTGLEEEWKTRYRGVVLGATSSVAVAVARHLGDAATFPRPLASFKALQAVRALHRFGGGFVTDDPATRCGFDEWAGCYAVAETLKVQAYRPSEKGRSSDREGLLDEVREFNRAMHEGAYACAVVGETAVGKDDGRRSFLIQTAAPSDDDALITAMRVIREGAKILAQVPRVVAGDLVAVDREEVECINDVRGAVRRYMEDSRAERPLSIAVFGPPGSGKSLAVREIARSLTEGRPQILTFNLSTMQSTGDDLATAMMTVQDMVVQGGVPFVFWDEFDSHNLDWLGRFLAPMQDGLFRHASQTHRIGRCIFVFAGGVCSTFSAFNRPDDVKFRDAKGTDFVSRLSGYMNIKGLHADDLAASDERRAAVIRRSLLTRSIIEREAPWMIHAATGKAAIADSVVAALLTCREFKHGARSLAAVIRMLASVGVQRGGQHVGPASLPSDAMVSVHVDPDEVRRIIEDEEAGAVEAGVLAEMARAAHDSSPFRDARDPWDRLSAEAKAAMERHAWKIWRRLRAKGYRPERSEDGGVPGAAPTHVEAVAREVYEDWRRRRVARGWAIGNNHDPKLRTASLLKAYEHVDGDTKEKFKVQVSKVLAALGSGWKLETSSLPKGARSRRK